METFAEQFSHEVIAALKSLPKREIARACNLLQAAFERDGRIYVFGNGGSLALATHWVSDFNKTVFSHNLDGHSRRFQAIRLPSTEEELTAWANDVGYEMVFAGPLRNYLQDSDTIIAISSSGNSPNVIKAVELARAHHIPVIGLSGFDGGRLNELADAKILVPTEKGKYGVVESVHGTILHLMTEYFKGYFSHLDQNNKSVSEYFTNEEMPQTQKSFMKNILVTGNNGYIGSVLVPELQKKGYAVTGLDRDYYRECELLPTDQHVRQITKDIRNVSAEDLEGIDGVIHLAALSNDPLGELAPHLTDDINMEATLRLARLAKAAGVGRFVYASSQSMYGVSDTDGELEEDSSEKNPVTSYARTKWEAEQELKKLHDENFMVVCFRPSTVFGASPRFRCDIVFNNFVSCAYTTGKIEVKSDGTPWRPVVHVRDVCSAFIAGLEAPAELVGGESFNVGVPNGNFTVRELAEAAQNAVPGSELTFTGEHGSDARTYRVSFTKILSVLKDYYQPEWTLERGAKEMVELFKQSGFSEQDFRGRVCNRLKQIDYLREQKKVDENLR